MKVFISSTYNQILHIIQYDAKSTKKICRIKLQCSSTHKKKKSNVHQERKITAHAMRCINALLT